MKELVGKLVTGVYVSNTQHFMKFNIKDEPPIIYYADGDCCSETWFADITVEYGFYREYRKDYPLQVVNCEELDIPEWLHSVIENDGRGRQESDCVYGFKLTFNDLAWKYRETNNMTIIFRNSSNGYYGGGVELLDEDSRYYQGLLNGVEWVEITDNWRSE